MANSPTWKRTLSFSDRFSVITQIANALATCHEMVSAEALKTAQAVESDCLNRASSYNEYVLLWNNELRGITTINDSKSKSYSSSNNNSNSNSNELTATDSHHDFHSASSSPVQTSNQMLSSLGPYTRPTYHADGTNSTVYKSFLPPSHCGFSTPSNHPTPLGLAVALKVATPSIPSPPHDAYSEAKILKSLLPHEAIIPLLETFTTPSTSNVSSYFILVFPFYPYSLASLPPLSFDPVEKDKYLKQILKDTISALAHLHKHGIIHRDVKPSNILLSDPAYSSSNPRAYLSDFGIAWSESTHANSTAGELPEEKFTDVGTTHYRPLEVLFGYRAYGTELDLWSLGCVVAECFLNELGGGRGGEKEGEEVWESFFDAGDLGSELRLIASIFKKLGTPTKESWPGASKLPDFGKIQFRDFPRQSWEELLPNASREARDLVDKLLRYEGSERITAVEALKHPLLAV